MIKNWTVISQPVKKKSRGLAEYLHYLNNPHHKNHTGKTDIYAVYGSAKTFYTNTINAVAERGKITAAKRRGGRSIASFAQSFVFTLPHQKKNRPTVWQWRNIAKKLTRDICDFTELSVTELNNNLFINIHDQSNPHLNLVISKVIGGEVRKELQKKSIINLLKKSFNQAVIQELGLSNFDYEPESKNSRRTSIEYYKQHKLNQTHTEFQVEPDNHRENEKLAFTQLYTRQHKNKYKRG